MAACQSRKMPDAAAVQKAEEYDRQQRDFIAKNRAEQAQRRAAAAMTSEQAAALEAGVRQNPEDVEARKKLLILYSRPAALGRAAQENGTKETIAARRQHVLWLIEHHPEHEFAASTFDPLPDPEGYAQARKAWLAQADRDGRTAAIYLNAVKFFRVSDKPLAEKMLLRAAAIDPRSADLLGTLYYEALIGSNAAMPMGVVRSVSADEAKGPYATEVRKKLDASTDAQLLLDVGRRLIDEYVPMDTGFDRRALGVQYIQQATRLQPDLRGAQHILTMDKRRQQTAGTLEERYQALAGMPAADRMKELAALAETGYWRGDMASYYQHDTAKAKAAWEHARKFGQEALMIAPNVQTHPNYGAAYFSANMTLGMVTMRNGDKKGAAKYLLAAAQAPPFKEMQSGFHPFAERLSTALLKAGERDAVAEFLDAYARVNIPNQQRWSQAAVLIRAGKTPYWVQN